MVKCFHCKIISQWKNRKKRFIVRRPIKCSKCSEIGFYTPPEYTTKLDHTIVCSKCMEQSPNPYFLMPCPVNTMLDIIPATESTYNWTKEDLKLRQERFNQSRYGQIPSYSGFNVNASAALTKFGIPCDKMVECPLCNYKTHIYTMIIHLNDVSSSSNYGISEGYPPHGQSFKFIGNWLKSLGY